MKRKIFMVRLTYCAVTGKLQVEHSDRRARTPQEAIQRATAALCSKNPRARIHGTAAYPYFVIH